MILVIYTQPTKSDNPIQVVKNSQLRPANDYDCRTERWESYSQANPKTFLLSVNALLFKQRLAF